MIPFPLPAILVEEKVRAALAEDLGDAGDLSTLASIPEETDATAVIRARKAGRIAGIDAALAAFDLTGPGVLAEIEKGDGEAVAPGDIVLRLEGAARTLLTAERVALNFLGHLSGIATATAALTEAVSGTMAKIVCTRKTTPGLRAFEKHAVRCGGGHNHRFGLYDAVMLKDNHIAAAGGIEKAMETVRARLGHMVKIEIEIDRLDQLDAALNAGADVVLLDNMSPAELREAVTRTNGRAILEASGNITAATVRAVAETGVDVISSGWITHSAPVLDLGMDFEG